MYLMVIKLPQPMWIVTYGYIIVIHVPKICRLTLRMADKLKPHLCDVAGMMVGVTIPKVFTRMFYIIRMHNNGDMK